MGGNVLFRRIAALEHHWDTEIAVGFRRLRQVMGVILNKGVENKEHLHCSWGKKKKKKGDRR